MVEPRRMPPPALISTEPDAVERRVNEMTAAGQGVFVLATYLHIDLEEWMQALEAGSREACQAVALFAAMGQAIRDRAADKPMRCLICSAPFPPDTKVFPAGIVSLAADVPDASPGIINAVCSACCNGQTAESICREARAALSKWTHQEYRRIDVGEAGHA